MGGGTVFSIPPGVPFLTVLARAIVEGRLVEGFRYDPEDPLSLARATIYLPTRRAARALRSEFVDLLGGRSAILPEIRPLGEIDDDAGYFDDALPDSLDLLPAITPMTRLIELGRLILAWRNMLPTRLRDIHKDSPLSAPASPADAIWLAKSLAELIDAVETEETGWDGLARIDLGDRALWWQLTGEFLKIASQYWPSRLSEINRASPALHRNQRIRSEARRIADGRATGPIIVAGSTGSIPATAALIMAIAGLKQGAVVLPGLDLIMDETTWQLAGAWRSDGTKNSDPASRSHPQYGLYHLLQRLRVRREDVHVLAEEPISLRHRSAAASAAFLPADAAINHRQWRDDIGQPSLTDAFADIALVEAANEREEALSIAIALKLSLHEGPREECQVALVTPDRDLARRVSTELRRFGIDADDSAGTPLSAAHHGSLVQLALDAILRPGNPVALASLLKHPLVRLGRSRADMVQQAGWLELLALRGGTALANPAELSAHVTHCIAGLKASYRKAWRTALDEMENQALVLELARDIEKAVEPLARMLVSRSETGMTMRFSLSAWAEATGQALEALCRDERSSLAGLWSGEAGDALAGLLAELIDSPDVMEASGPEWADALAALMAGIGIKPRAISHPRVFIWGTLEARLQQVDMLVLGGLNEGMWPGQTANNPFLSRVMKTEIGLEPPERRIGQAAHDFAMGLGTRKLVLTRALRQSGAPSVPSRFLQRLESVTGSEIAAAMRSRGQRYRDLADQIDLGERQAFAARPEPRPDALLQPKQYSFSEAGKLRRDPYAIYARRILRLDPVDPFNQDPGAAERGTIYHGIVEAFIRSGVDPRSDSALATITALADAEFAKAGLPPHVEAIWHPRFLDLAPYFLAEEAKRRPLIRESLVEVNARIDLPLADLTLTGRADRIDIRKDGRADIIDYKTGSSPSMKEARALLDPQLSLEAAALKLGGFKGLKAMDSQDLLYVRLKPGAGFKVETVNNEDSTRLKPEDRKSAADLAENAQNQLIRLTAALREKKAGFKSRVAPFKDRDYGGEYDHLARVAEWSTADDGEEGEDG